METNVELVTRTNLQFQVNRFRLLYFKSIDRQSCASSVFFYIPCTIDIPMIKKKRIYPKQLNYQKLVFVHFKWKLKGFDNIFSTLACRSFWSKAAISCIWIYHPGVLNHLLKVFLRERLSPDFELDHDTNTENDVFFFILKSQFCF